MRRAALGLCAVLLAGPARANGVLSLNLCSDQLLLALAEPGEIAGVTQTARDCRLSAECARAADVPAIRGAAEEVIALRPRLVLAGPSGAEAAQRVARLLAIPVVVLGYTPDLDAIRAQIGQVAAAIGHPDRGAALLQAFDRRLVAVPPPDPARRPVAAVYGPSGYTVGPGSLADAVLARAGLANWATLTGHEGTIPLETLLAHPPDLLVTGEPAASPSLSESMVWHPSLLQRFAGRRVEIPARDFICGSPATLDALETLTQARLATAP